MSQDEYKLTKKRTTDELENDETTVNTKNISLYGWDGSSKVKIAVTSAGLLKVTI
jgi:hypothetical protein